MDLGLEGSCVLITGGASGIGAAVVYACAQEGGLPVIVDREKVAIAELQADLHRQGLRSECVLTDLTDISNTCRTIEDFGRRHGRIDGLVNNAGTNDAVGLERGTPDDFLASLRRNLVHYYSVTHTALPFLKQSRGAVVNISSKVAVTGQGGTSGYAAAKGAILELTTDWAAELASYGVRVNAVIPAEVMTGQYEKWLQKFQDPQEKLREICSRIPLEHRMTQPNEIANAVMLLLSPRLSVTGQQIFVDGGYVHLDRALA